MKRSVSRARPADDDERQHWAIMARTATQLARWLTAGVECPGHAKALAWMPPSVQAAVLSHRSPNSRYIPSVQRAYDAAYAKARAEGRRRIHTSEWAPSNSDPSAVNRNSPIFVPGTAPYGSRIINAIAAEANVSPATIRMWVQRLADVFEEEDRRIFGDAVKRKPGNRRSSRGKRHAE